MSTHYPHLPFFILPYTRMELPGWGKLFRLLGVGSDNKTNDWDSAPVTWSKGKWHHYRMKLDLSDWCDRHTYFLGRYYELATQLAIKAILKPGDRFVDVGANHGMISLLAAYLVGKSGRVESVEPNPACIQRIKEHINQNNLQHIHIHPCAFGSEDTTLNLTLLTEHSGYGTLTHIPDKDKHLVTRIIEVPVKFGDKIIAAHNQPVAMIKIDVEGFELNTLTGLTQTLQNHHCPVLTEVLDGYLLRAGNTRAQLIAFMNKLGYVGYQIRTHRKLFKHVLRLVPMPTDATLPMCSTDVLWLHKDMSQTADLLGKYC